MLGIRVLSEPAAIVRTHYSLARNVSLTWIRCRAEQALRPCVIFRKVTNCFRSEWAAHLYADIRSVIETARRKAIGALEAIRLTLKGLSLTASLQDQGVAPYPSG